MENFLLTGAPELCDAQGLEEIVSRAAADGITVFSFEDPARFPLSDQPAVCVNLEFPDATRLWQAWLGTDEQTRQQWMGAIPQPLYLKPPHITPGKRASLVR